VEKGAHAATIKKEYRKPARKYHPDVKMGTSAEQQFKEPGEAYEGRVVDAEDITLMQLSHICQRPPQFVIELVDEGILEPDGASVSRWRSSFSVVERVKTVARFQHDLRVNLPGAALALELLDRIEKLQSQLLQR
jgi:chaperone modulatory protein CbpM